MKKSLKDNHFMPYRLSGLLVALKVATCCALMNFHIYLFVYKLIYVGCTIVWVWMSATVIKVNLK